jgi:RNA polymerase sigma factor (TIGR02999 family)
MCAIGSEVTALLDRWSGGDREALDELIPLIFEDVRELARRHLAHEPPGHTLQPTALVHEVYLRLEKRRTVSWKNREQFFGFLAQLIRRILVDHARGHRRTKRGGGRRPLSLEDVFGLSDVRHPELVALDDALKDLARIDPRQSRIVELRYFIGLTLEQIAAVLGLSLTTVNREWKTARMWLLRELSREMA